MMFRNTSPTAIAEELGERLKQTRLNANLSQAELALRTGLNRRTILNAEKGQVQLKNLIAILASLGLTEQLNLFLPEQEISPLQLAKLKGKKRLRASRSQKRGNQSNEDNPSW